MKKVFTLIFVLVLCLSLCACGASKEPEEVELTVNNFDEYLTVSFEINNFDEGRLTPDEEIYNPSFDLVINVKATDSKYKFADTKLKLILTDKANSLNTDMALGAEIIIDSEGNGVFTKEGIDWIATSVAKPDYQILTAVSEVSGILIG